MGCMSLTCQHAHKSNYCSRHRSNSSGSHCNHDSCCPHGQQKNGMIKDNSSGVVSVDMTDFCKWEKCGKPEVCSPRSHRSVKSTSSVDDFNLQTTATPLFDDHNNDKHLHGDDNGSCSSKRNHVQRRSILNNDNSQNYSEVPRFILSYVYMAICGFANSLVVILAHDVFPLRSKYPPLPDLLLDNLPYKTWAFPASEVCAGVLMMFTFILFAVHKHRFVIMRRTFIIYGTILVMRCPCMLLTSLSVCNEFMECDPKLNDTVWSKLKRASDLYMKLGLSSRGVRTCGDYMYSGHTVIISLLNYSITEYSPLLLVHVVTWSLTILALVFIMLGHAHYSIDVIIAFFISSLYFNYYQTLANNHSPSNSGQLHVNNNNNCNNCNNNNNSNNNNNNRLKQDNGKTTMTSPSSPSSPTGKSLFQKFCVVTRRNRIWVPFYSYLERRTSGQPLPHEYESPLTALLRCFRKARHRVIQGKVRKI